MPPHRLLPEIVLVFLGAGLLSYGLSFLSRFWAIQYRALDIPKNPRKIHKEPMPLWGGIGIALALSCMILILGLEGSIFDGKVTAWQIVGFLFGIGLLNFGGMLDDRYELKAWQSMIFPVLASLSVIITGTTILHVTNPGTAMPFYLDWWVWRPFHMDWGLYLPSDLLTLVWMLVAIYATKITDGLDGLVSGITVIGASMVGALSSMPTFYQPATAILSAAVGGAYAGFLPRNFHPAKQFLGEGGATIAGFCLGFLAIVSSAKIAIALAVLALPLADLGWVFLRRIYHHKPWYKGDDSHLHFRLLAAGLSHTRAVLLLWLLSASAGMIALFLQTSGKIFLVAIVALLTLFLSWMSERAIRKRSVK